MWDELRLTPLTEFVARRRDPITGIQVGVRVGPPNNTYSSTDYDALLLFAVRPGQAPMELNMGAYNNNVLSIIFHLQYFDRMAPLFEADEILVTRFETASMRRITVDLYIVLQAMFARKLFRLLRGRVFRRLIRRRVRAKLLLSRSEDFRALPSELVRGVSDAWL